MATVNGMTIVEVFGGGSAGSGNIHPFVRVQASPTEQGYNSSAPFEFDETGGVTTPDVPLSSIPKVTIGTSIFRQLVLDANEPGDGDERLLSLEEFELYCSPTTGNSNYFGSASNLGTLIYDMNSAGAEIILLSDNNSGSGDIDYVFYIPDTFFVGCATNDFVYLFSKFGPCIQTAGGFEEWAFTDNPFVPPAMDIGVTKDDGDGDVETTAVLPGDQYNYTIIVSNTAPPNATPLDATDVMISDTLPPNVTFVSATDGSCVATTGGFECGPFDLVVGGTTSITVTVELDAGAPACDTITNLVTVSANELDVDPTNDSDEEPTDVVRCNITITCPENVTLECDESANPANTGQATASTDCDGVDITFTDNVVTGACAFNITITRTWRATSTSDAANLVECVQVITVEDATAPEISCPPDVTIDCVEGDAGTATATDDCDADPEISSSDAAALDDCGLGTITRTWTATDCAGNRASCDQVITVAPAQLVLTVVSAHGQAHPGTVTVDYGTFVEQWVTNSPAAGGAGTQYVCVAGAVVGNDFTQVSPTNVTLTVTNDATLTWQWRTEYWLDTSAGPGGTVDVGDGWYSNGAAVAIMATASEGSHLLSWNGDVPAGMETNNPLSVTMNRSRAIAAVFATNIGGRVESVISASSDDAEEWYDGTVQLVSADLELIHNVKTWKLDQVVGLRFPNLAIPAGAVIRSAYIQFTARQNESDPCSLTVRVERVDSALAFVEVANNISSRTVTTSAVPWDAAAWIGDEAGTSQRTPDLAALVQEVVDRAGWQSGNALSFIITGKGTRTAMSYAGDAARAPVLHLVWGWSAETLPQVANALPNGISPTSATLVGDLLSEGGTTTAAWLYWGRADGGTNKLAWTNGGGLGVVSEGEFQSTVSGLSPNTVYYYRAYALNSVGEAWAADSAQFATLSGGDVTNGMVLHWKLDEGGGTLAADSSGHGNTGTVVNAGAGDWVPGRFGSGLSINGGTPYVFNTGLSEPLSGNMTLTCWIFSHSPAGLAIALAGATGVEWHMREDGDLGRMGWENAGGPDTALYTTWSMHLDLKWHHVAFVRKGTTYRLYVDNRFVGTSTGTVVSYTALWAGRNPGGTGWQGEIDDVRLYDRALSWGEIGSLQAGEGLGPFALHAPVIVHTDVPGTGEFTIMWRSEPLVEYSVHRALDLFSLPGITLTSGVPADPTGTNRYTDSTATNVCGFYIIKAFAP